MTESTHKETPLHILWEGDESYASFSAPTTWIPTHYSYKHTYVSVADGVKDPNWRRKVVSHQSATTPFSGVLYRGSSVASVGEHKFWVHPTFGNFAYRRWYKRSGAYLRHVGSSFYASLPSMPTSGSEIQTADNQAIARLYSSLVAIENRVQSGEDFGEWRETLKLVKRPFHALTTAVTDLMQGHINAFKWKDVRSVAKALADTTLEWRFGVKPLISTVSQGFVGLQNRDNVFHYSPFYSHGVSRTVSRTMMNDGYGLDPLDLQYLESKVQSQSVRYKGMWHAQSDLPKRAVSDVLGLNFRNVIPTIYNLIPYSFLLDYVTNVGDIVNSLAVPWSGVAWCCKTVQHTYLLRQDAVDWSKQGPSNYYRVGPKFLLPGYVEIQKTAFERSEVTEIPYPKLALQMPGFRQLQNVAALLVSRMGKTLPKIQKATASRANLADAFEGEVGRRGLRIPYPFHSSP